MSLSRRVSVLSRDGTSLTIVGCSRTHRPETVTFEEGHVQCSHPLSDLRSDHPPFNKVGRLEFENMLLYQRLKTLQDNDNRIGISDMCNRCALLVTDFLTINIEADDI